MGTYTTCTHYMATCQHLHTYMYTFNININTCIYRIIHIYIHTHSIHIYIYNCLNIYIYIYIFIYYTQTIIDISYTVDLCRPHVQCLIHLSKRGGTVTTIEAPVRLLRLLSVCHLLLVFLFPVAFRDGLNLWN